VGCDEDDQLLDAEFAFQQLIDPSVQTVNITNPTANLTGAIAAATAAQQTPQGRARLALTAALGDTPGWFTPLSFEPPPTDFAGQEANQFSWETQVDFPFIFAFRAELEARAGGNPSWNTGVNYSRDLARSADATEVAALYRAAGLSLRRDLRTLERDTGRWDRSALDPASLNAQAAALGPQFNIFQVGTAVVPTPPAFLRYRPAPYLRPFDLAPGGS
jgi:hypothetical protein